MHLSLGQVLEVIKVAALVAGGIWTVWIFHKLQSARTAELKNKQTLTELLRQQPVLDIEIKVAEAVCHTKKARGFLCITVTLKNQGDQNLMAVFDNAALTVGHIVSNNDGEQTTDDLWRFGHWYFAPDIEQPQSIPERIFRAGQRRQLAFSVPITEVGGYLIQFHTIYQRWRFEGEQGRNTERSVKIDAVEQAVFFATGNPTAAVDSPSHA